MAVTAKRPNAESCVTPVRSSRRELLRAWRTRHLEDDRSSRRFDRELKPEELTALPRAVDHCGRSIARGCWLLSTSALVARVTYNRRTLSRRPWQSTTASAPPRVSRTLTATG